MMEFNDQIPMTNEQAIPVDDEGSSCDSRWPDRVAERPVFDLEERTARFGEAAIRFCRELPRDDVTRPLVSQSVRAATSIGANDCEADDAESRRDFRHKISLCHKEARETKHFLRMISVAVELHRESARELWREADELCRIFAAIRKKVNDA